MSASAANLALVATVAVKAGAQVIVTSNIRDFAPLPQGVEALPPDVFLKNLFDLNPEALIELLREQAEDLVNPPMTFDDLLDRLARVAPGLVTTVRSHQEQ